MGDERLGAGRIRDVCGVSSCFMRCDPHTYTIPYLYHHTTKAGLGAWWNKMLKTKAVAALKGKGKKLMPGEHNKAW